MSHSIDLSDKRVRDIFEESYEYILSRGYSFDELSGEYDAVRDSDRIPSSYQSLLRDRDPILVKECILHSLEKIFDDKEYDKDILQKIATYKKDFLESDLTGTLMVINRRNGITTESAQHARHWPVSILDVAQHYPNDLDEFLEVHKDHFELLWTSDDIAVYQMTTFDE